MQLKGRVACEISNHELMITELVFENAFTNLHPTEIVALLSCFVFQQVNVAFSLGPLFTDYILTPESPEMTLRRLINI